MPSSPINPQAKNLKLLVDGGVLHPDHKLNDNERSAVGKLNATEIKALISAKNKLGVEALSRSTKGGKFPHPRGVSF